MTGGDFYMTRDQEYRIRSTYWRLPNTKEITDKLPEFFTHVAQYETEITRSRHPPPEMQEFKWRPEPQKRRPKKIPLTEPLPPPEVKQSWPVAKAGEGPRN